MLKSTVMKKTSGLLATLLIMSMLVPVLAFAGFFASNTNFDHNGNVTGSVYFTDTVGTEVYGGNGAPVTFDVYDRVTNQFITAVTATYSTYTNGKYVYNLPNNTVLNSVYSQIYFKYNSTNGSVVTDTVYKAAPPCTSNCGTPGGGGGTGGGGTTNPSTELTSNGTIAADVLKAALASYLNVTIKLTGDSITIPVAALVDAASKAGATITVVNENGTYVLPLSVLDLTDLTELKLTIKKVTGDDAIAVASAVSEAGAEALSDAVEFVLVGITKDGKTIEINDFGQTYVKRKMSLNKEATKTATVALFDPATGKLIFVPGKVSGKEAQFMRTGNSIYVVVETSNSFSDITGHWAKGNIELLASKFIVEGTAADIFEPDRNITRAEFAALVTRSLGLTATATSATYFTDVKGDAWYTGVVGAAKAAGLVDGYEDGSFKPNAQITREELAAMVVRALKFAGQDTTVSATEQASLLSKFTDADQIVWAQNEIAAAVKAGIVDGMTDTTIAPNENATRAQSATMLKRLLTNAGFIE